MRHLIASVVGVLGVVRVLNPDLIGGLLMIYIALAVLARLSKYHVAVPTGACAMFIFVSHPFLGITILYFTYVFTFKIPPKDFPLDGYETLPQMRAA